MKTLPTIVSHRLGLGVTALALTGLLSAVPHARAAGLLVVFGILVTIVLIGLD